MSLISDKLSKKGYACHYIGKGHLSYQTTDHLLVNRGFKTHVGFLEGSQHYAYGCPNSGCKSNTPADPQTGSHDMWHDEGPGLDIVPKLYYSANTYTDRAVAIIDQHNANEPLSLHMMYQNVHSPYTKPPGE